MNLAAARSFRFVPPTLRASSALLLISTPPDSQFPLVFNPSLYRKPRYISYQQYASSTPWCRPCAYSRSQRSYQAYCRSSAPSGCPPAAAPASLDVCVPGPAAASRSGTAPGPAGFGLWSLRTDGIDCSVSLDTRGYIFSSFAVICWWQQPFALTGGMELDALASYGMTDSLFSTVVLQLAPLLATLLVAFSVVAAVLPLSNNSKLLLMPSLWTVACGRVPPTARGRTTPLARQISRTSAGAWMSSRATCPFAVGTWISWYVYYQEDPGSFRC